MIFTENKQVRAKIFQFFKLDHNKGQVLDTLIRDDFRNIIFVHISEN